ncbi:unnamed protein product [Vitrella brassicaformis CCMP3155]|uniref:Uncharacterized protein n=2 Tax=Vitrella brassicaformis TaxID=1169539 RepID=A0A0G4EI23_VITBC|nr:unnamed protein product [Vitrella brassicaformis CCMP3155]|eukprot:CEL95638.1 unnamed protein product [Vitrella brassicaformis CCMP3155]
MAMASSERSVFTIVEAKRKEALTQSLPEEFRRALSVADSEEEATAEDLQTIAEAVERNAFDVDTRDPSGSTLLALASSRGKVDIATMLIGKGADVAATDKLGFTPLHVAAANGQRDVVKELIDAGAEVSQENNWGAQPLHLAASSGTPEVCDLLLSTGGSVSATDLSGRTPLLQACQTGNYDTVALLGPKDMSAVNKPDCDQYVTPLHAAATHGHLPTVELLLRLGADPTARDVKGQTPLHSVAAAGNRRDKKRVLVARALCEAGADMEATDDEGRTAVDLAKSVRHTAFIAYAERGELPDATNEAPRPPAAEQDNPQNGAATDSVLEIAPAPPDGLITNGDAASARGRGTGRGRGAGTHLSYEGED